MPSFQERQRAWLDELRERIGSRAATEDEIARLAREDAARIAREHREALDAAEARWSDLLRLNQDACADRIAQARAAFETDRDAAARRRDAEVGAFKERTDAHDAASRKRLEESLWLADTMSESGAAKVRQEFDRRKREIEARAARARAIREDVDLLVGSRTSRAEALGEGLSLDAGEAPPSDPDAAIDAAAASLESLRSRIRPVLLRPGILVIPTLIALGLTAWILVRWGADPASGRRLAAWSGAGAGLLALGLIAFWLANRRHIPGAIRHTGRAVAAAVRAVEHALAQAEADRDRRIEEIRDRRQRDHERSRGRYAAAMEEVRLRREERGPALLARHEERIRLLGERFEQSVARLEQGRDERLRIGREVRDRAVQQAESRRERETADAAARHAEAFESLRAEWTTAMQRLHAEGESIRAEMAAVCPGWGAPSWDRFEGAAAAPVGVSLGNLSIDLSTFPGGLSSDPRLAINLPAVTSLPAVLDVTGLGSLLILASPETRAEALGILRNAMLRLLAAFPPAKVRFTLLDPVGLGESFAAFMHLADHDGALVGEKIWTEPRHIEQRLTDLTEHMETVIQKYLRNQFATIQDYNAAAGEVAEPYRFLVIADFPANISEAAAKRLASIASSGARCGVFTLIAADTRARPAPFIPMDELERSGIVLRHREGRFTWNGPPFASHPLTLEAPPPESLQTRLLNEVGLLAKDASRVRVPYELLRPERIWSGDASRELRVPLGRAGALKLQELSLGGGTAQHALVAGRTGSGKSTLLHVLITTLAAHYSPDEVELYLVDFKKGVEFKTYATHRLPHARVIAVESEREFGLSVLKRLDAELSARGALFRDRGVQDLAAYRESGGPARGRATMPRVLLIVDEFQEFFVEDDRLAQEASLLLDRLVRQGRAFGMHVVLGSQTLSGAYSLARSTMGQMGVRIALQCSETDAYLIMSEDNTAPRLLSRPGEAIYNDASGLVEGNSPFQVAWLEESARERELARIHAALGDRPPPPPAIVFEGHLPAAIAGNHPLRLALGRAGPAPKAPLAWVGDPISIKDPTSIAFAPQGGSNLLIVGQSEEQAGGIMLAAAISLAACRPDPASAPTFILLGSPDPPGPLAGLVSRLGGRIVAPRHIADAMRDLAEELDRRTEASTAQPSAFLMVNGIQRLRDLRRRDEFALDEEQAGTPPEQLARLLRDGPAHGLHTILWSDTLLSLERALDRRTIREFAPRILTQMSAADSTALIDSPAAGSLGRHRAILYHDDLGTMEKFRPYAYPDPQWLDEAVLRVLSTASPANNAPGGPVGGPTRTP